jgi:uncharacterized cupredoxin-like copper-binding protein
VPPAEGVGRLRRAARLAVVTGVVLLLAGVALYPARSGPEIAREIETSAAAPAAAAPVTITVNATDQPAFDPSTIVGTAGTTLTLSVHNAGAYPHTFTISAVANFTIPAAWSPAQLDAFFAANGSLVNLSLAPGSTAVANLSLPLSDAGDTFQIVSLTPYQFQSGMAGSFQVAYATSAGAYALTTQTTDSLLFVPASLAIPAATHFPITVSVQVENAGSTLHTFTIEGQENNTLESGNFSTYFQTHPPLANVNVPTTPGVPVWANFTITAKGAYEFICEVSGHFAHGMYGWLYVGYTPSPPAAPPSTALLDVSFLVGAGALLGLAILLTVVATFVGRFSRPPRGPAHP